MGCGLSGRIAVLAVAVILYLLMLSGAKKIAEMNDPQTLIRIALTFILLYFVVGKILSFAKNLWEDPALQYNLTILHRFSPWYRLLGNPLDDTFKSFPFRTRFRRRHVNRHHTPWQNGSRTEEKELSVIRYCLCLGIMCHDRKNHCRRTFSVGRDCRYIYNVSYILPFCPPCW